MSFLVFSSQLELSNDELLSLQSQVRTSQEKEHHWNQELSQTSADLQLSKEKMKQLEGELREKERTVEELRLKLASAQRLQQLHEREVSELVKG